MDLAIIERGVALIGAIVVGVFALIALKDDWHAKGLDNNTTKLLLGLMAFGCIMVFFAQSASSDRKAKPHVRSNPYKHGIPVSAGIPPIIRWSGIIGLIAIFCVVGIVIASSRYGHVWPSADSTHIKLGS